MHICDNWESVLVPAFLIRKLQEYVIANGHPDNQNCQDSTLPTVSVVPHG